MKKLALALCLLAVSFTAQAQFEKGTTIINPSLSGLDFSYSKNDKAKFGVGAQVGTFFAEGIALMVNAGADWSKPIDEVYQGIADYVKNFQVSDRDMLKYIIGTVSELDTPLTPSGKGSRSLSAYLNKMSEEERHFQ